MAQVQGTSSNGDAVVGTSSGNGVGVRGISTAAAGVLGGEAGVVGQCTVSGNGVSGLTANGQGVLGESADGGAGVWGVARGQNRDGVHGASTVSGNGVSGTAEAGAGVSGTTVSGDGVFGNSESGGAGVHGIANGQNQAGVIGESKVSGAGVSGEAASGDGVVGLSHSTGAGVHGISTSEAGVYGESIGSGTGVHGFAADGIAVSGTSKDGGPGVWGTAFGKNQDGVYGLSEGSGNGVHGYTASGDGVLGNSAGGGAGVHGVSQSNSGPGVLGENTAGGPAGAFIGHVGIGTSSPQDLVTVQTAANDAGITLQGANSAGGVSPTLKFSDNAATVHARIGIAGAAGNLTSGSSPNDLVIRTEGNNIALTTNYGAPSALTVATSGNVGIGTSAPLAPLHVVADPSGSTTSVLIESSGSPRLAFVDTSTGDHTNTGAPAWYVGNFGDLFQIFRTPNVNTVGPGCLSIDKTGTVNVANNLNVLGNLNVNGDVFLQGADCAEQFDAAGATQIEPGTVVVIDQEGALRESNAPYDKKVAGVVSGAGGYRPGIVLDKQQSQDSRVPVALVGKVYCKVDAQYSPIDIGDLLTSSPTPGHAMKAADPAKAFGTIIGKALRSLAAGSGLIPVLVALQ